MERILNKVMIVDGSYMLHRALHTPGLSELCTVDGVKSGGVYGVLKMIQVELKKFPGYMPIFCWDKGLSSRRTTIFPDYKANRKRLEADNLLAVGVNSKEDDEYLEEYHRQRADLIQILQSLGIPSILENGWEGDDLMYILSLMSEDGVIVSDDKDLIQLVSPNTKIRRAMKNETITWQDSDITYRHPHFTIAKSINGDRSDNIPQAATGVGEASSEQIASILDKYDSLEDYYKCLEEYVNDPNSEKKKIVKKVQSLLEGWHQFVVNYHLINLKFVEIPTGFDSMLKDTLEIKVGKSNLFEAYKWLGIYELNSIFPDQIISMVSIAISNFKK